MPFLSEPEKGGDESCSSGHNPTIPDQYQPASLIINNSHPIQSQSFSHRKCDDVTCIGSVSSSLNVVLNIYFNEFGALYYDVLYIMMCFSLWLQVLQKLLRDNYYSNYTSCNSFVEPRI